MINLPICQIVIQKKQPMLDPMQTEEEQTPYHTHTHTHRLINSVLQRKAHYGLKTLFRFTMFQDEPQ